MLIDDLPMWGYLGEVCVVICDFAFHSFHWLPFFFHCRLCTKNFYWGNQFKVPVSFCIRICTSALAIMVTKLSLQTSQRMRADVWILLTLLPDKRYDFFPHTWKAVVKFSAFFTDCLLLHGGVGSHAWSWVWWSHEALCGFHFLANYLWNPLVVNHQLFCVGAFAHGIFVHYSHAHPEAGFLEVHGNRRGIVWTLLPPSSFHCKFAVILGWAGWRGNRLEDDSRRRVPWSSPS